MMDLKVEVYIVRHGETEANRCKILQGQSDYPLNEKGKLQATKAARKLSSIQFDLAFTSDLSRASETCDIILKDSATKARKRESLRERKFGSLEGQPLEKFQSEAAGSKLNHWWHYTPEGGETMEDLRQRAGDFFNDFCEELMNEFKSSGESKKVLIASHGGFIKDLIGYMVQAKGCRMPKGADFRSIPANCAITTIEIIFDLSAKKAKSVSCLSLHDVSHMDDSRSYICL